MSKLIRLFTLILCFSLDVQVRALEGTVEAKRTRKSMAVGEGEVVLKAGGLVQKLSETQLRLIRGTMLAQVESDFTLQTPYAKFFCVDSCLALFERGTDHVIIRSLKGNWSVRRTGDAQVYQIPIAASLRVGEVTPDGQADLDFPQSLPWSPTVKEWGGLFSGSSKEFKAEVEEFHEVWQSAVQELTKTHAEAATRAIAANDQERARQEARARAQAAEDAKLRQMFREKNYIYP